MPRVLIFDSTCPHPYDPDTLRTQGLGGTEATVIRVAEALAGRGFTVDVLQHNRKRREKFGAVYDFPTPHYLAVKYDSVIVLRDPDQLAHLQRHRFSPNTKYFFWMHDLYFGCSGRTEFKAYQDKRTTLVTVSEFHKQQVVDRLRAFSDDVTHFPRVARVYNPIDDELLPNDEPVDKNKLVFFSSPHKGLGRALKIFNILRTFHNPDFKLYLSNPGYFPSIDVYLDGVVNLDILPHQEVIKHVRQALCVFYPNVSFLETFGLVFAESNAVGTPVLAHHMGAASEVLGDQNQVLDCHNDEAVIRRIMAWHDGGRPTVTTNPQFRLKEVTDAWVKLLN